MRTLTAIALLALLSACGGGDKPTTMTECGGKLMWGVFGIPAALGCTYDVTHQAAPAAAPRAVPVSSELP